MENNKNVLLKVTANLELEAFIDKEIIDLFEEFNEYGKGTFWDGAWWCDLVLNHSGREDLKKTDAYSFTIIRHSKESIDYAERCKKPMHGNIYEIRQSSLCDKYLFKEYHEKYKLVRIIYKYYKPWKTNYDRAKKLWLCHLIFRKIPEPEKGIMQLIESNDLTNIELAYLLTYQNEES